MTISLYYTPNDRLIQASGIIPDVRVGTGSVPYSDSMPDLEPERAHPRHLRPEDFRGQRSPDIDETAAVRAAGEDVQLRVAVQHLQAQLLVPGRGRRG